jgi:hypothetical protein
VRPAEELLTLPVKVNGIELGRTVDLILDGSASRAVGLDVRCGDGAHRFVPFAVANVGEDAIEIDSPLVLLDFGQVAFYREQGTTLRALDGQELLIGPDGHLDKGTLTSGPRW